jgi:hypothetical protein
MRLLNNKDALSKKLDAIKIRLLNDGKTEVMLAKGLGHNTCYVRQILNNLIKVPESFFDKVDKYFEADNGNI